MSPETRALLLPDPRPAVQADVRRLAGNQRVYRCLCTEDRGDCE